MKVSEFIDLVINQHAAYYEICDVNGETVFYGSIRQLQKDPFLLGCTIQGIYLPQDTNFTTTIIVFAE